MPSIPQIAFTLIFPLAVLIILTGWTVAIVTFIRRIRARKTSQGSHPRRTYLPRKRRSRSQDAWELANSALTRGNKFFTPLS